MVNGISVTILTKNSQKYIKECLVALADFNEIIILDNGSNDKTLEIAKKFKNVKIYKSEFIGFGPLKNLAIEYASEDWILSIDSDEIFSKDLVKEILNLKLENNCVYSILRHNYYNGEKVNCCGWQNDWVNRLFNKNHTKFNNRQVHESIILNKKIKIKKLKNNFKHYSYDNASQLIEKMQKYSTLYAQDNKNHIKHIKLAIFRAYFNALYSFIKNYFFQKGFLYGYRGLLISVSNASGVFYKYIKLYEMSKNDY